MKKRSKRGKVKTMATSTTTKGNGKGKNRKGNQPEEKRRGRTPKAADAPFAISDPAEMLKKHPVETRETIDAIAKDKTIKRSAMYGLHGRLALRLAYLGLVAVDTRARNATERTYKATSKTNMKALAAALKKAPQPTAAQ